MVTERERGKKHGDEESVSRYTLGWIEMEADGYGGTMSDCQLGAVTMDTVVTFG